MDISWAHSLFTIWIFVSFALVLYIVTRKRNRQNYTDAASSIINDDDTPH